MPETINKSKHPLYLVIVMVMLAGLSACAAAPPAGPEPNAPAARHSLGSTPYISVVDIPTRPGVSQRVLIMAPHYPRAVLLLFPGGDGRLEMDYLGLISKGEDGFLVRAASRMVSYGLAAAVVDAPTDRQEAGGLSGGFRCSAEHGQDINEIMLFLRERWPELTLWAVGFDNGAISAALAALPGQDQPAGGLVLGAVKALYDVNGCSFTSLALENIEAPALMLHHEKDACPLAPFDEAEIAASRLSGARDAELLAVSGGSAPGLPCSTRSYHGFWGRENDVTDSVIRWVVATLPEKPAESEEGEAK